MDNWIDDMWLLCLKLYILDRFCVCVFDIYLIGVSELFKLFKWWCDIELVIVDIELLYERVVWWNS